MEKSGFKIKLVILGNSCFGGMASSNRIGNLIRPLIDNELVKVNNIIYRVERDIKLDELGRIDGVDYYDIRYNRRNVFSIVRFYYRGVRILRKEYDSGIPSFIYNYGGPNIENIIFLIIGKIFGYKIVSDIVEDDRYSGSYGVLNEIRRKSTMMLLPLSRYYLSATIAISYPLFERCIELMKGRVESYLVPICYNSKIRQISYGSREDGRIRIFYGGSFNEKDNFPVLIEAYEEICELRNNVDLILTGTGTEKDMLTALRLINESRFSSRISYLGYLETGDYLKVIYTCQIFCMTRNDSSFARLGFPFKLGEYLACGGVVVASKIEEVERYLRHGENSLLVQPNSVLALVDAIEYVLNNPACIEKLGQKARLVAETYFNSDVLSKELYGILCDVCGEPKS